MTRLPVLTEKDMAIFKGKKVVLYTWRTNAIGLYKCFRYCGIEVLCCCKEEKFRWQQCVKDRIRGLADITVEQLPYCIKKYDNIIIQSVEFDPAQIRQVHDVAKQLGVECSPFTSGEILNTYLPFIELQMLKNPLLFSRRKIQLAKNVTVVADSCWNYFQREKLKTLVVICSPSKTADHSLMYTFDALNAGENRQSDNCQVPYINVWHAPRAMHNVTCRKNITKIKVIMGIREPVSQNLSSLYQLFSSGWFVTLLPFLYAEMDSDMGKEDIKKIYSHVFIENAGNIQVLWDEYTRIYTNACGNLGNEKIAMSYIQSFISVFQNQVVNILSYPFDKEKGYAIVQEGNMEVFVYQLEKLNNLVPELSEWIGVSFDKLKNGNHASDKWIADSYKQAQKEIRITQEYFEKCFDEPYVKHCYSEADIEKFKARWRPHIKK